mmetsp:Transcript_963/g.2902  ORF Transcript_963/g.2902 Transcript_963/m.2902 type:complete len:262 (+) Transcript_963:1214-1999(+)
MVQPVFLIMPKMRRKDRVSHQQPKHFTARVVLLHQPLHHCDAVEAVGGVLDLQRVCVPEAVPCSFHEGLVVKSEARLQRPELFDRLLAQCPRALDRGIEQLHAVLVVVVVLPGRDAATRVVVPKVGLRELLAEVFTGILLVVHHPHLLALNWWLPFRGILAEQAAQLPAYSRTEPRLREALHEVEEGVKVARPDVLRHSLRVGQVPERQQPALRLCGGAPLPLRRGRGRGPDRAEVVVVEQGAKSPGTPQQPQYEAGHQDN